MFDYVLPYERNVNSSTLNKNNTCLGGIVKIRQTAR